MFLQLLLCQDTFVPQNKFENAALDLFDGKRSVAQSTQHDVCMQVLLLSMGQKANSVPASHEGLRQVGDVVTLLHTVSFMLFHPSKLQAV